MIAELGAVVPAHVVAGPAADVQAIPARLIGAERVAGHGRARRHQRVPAARAAAPGQGQVCSVMLPLCLLYYTGSPLWMYH